MSDDTTTPSSDKLLVRARRIVDSRDNKSPIIAVLKELADAYAQMTAREEEIRREAFLEGVRGAAKVVREKKESLRAGDRPDAGGAEAADGAIHDEVADRILEVATVGEVTVKALRDLLARTETASGDLAGLDADLVRTYYALANRHRPTAAGVLPLGRPTASLDIALAMAGRLLPEGWWSLGANFGEGGDPPTALIGTSPADDPKPRTAATPPLAVLTALLHALVEEERGNRPGR